MAAALTPAEIFAKAQVIGEAKATLSARRTLALSVAAGLFIGLGGMFMLLVKADGSLGFAASALLGGAAFSLGLFAVVVAGAELFTGNNLMVLGCLVGRYTPVQLLRSWALVYAGNLLGSLLLVGLLVLANYAGMGEGALAQAAVNVAGTKCGLPWMVAFGRGIMCNVLVCLAVWMSFAGSTVVDKFVATAVPVCAFVACGFEHCVANMFFLPFGLAVAGTFAGQVTVPATLGLAGLLSNLTACTAGNIVGGAAVFAGIYWLAFGARHT